MNKNFINDYRHDGNILNNYFKDIRDSGRITNEEEIELAIRITKGDESAIEELVLANLKFVISIAKQFQGRGITLVDLINEGNYGLIKAAYKFDITKNVKFISYAVWWIRQSIIQSITEDSRMIRLPANVVQKVANIKKELNLYELTHGEVPELSELECNDMDYGMSEIDAYNNTSCTSLNNIINDDGDELQEFIPFCVDDEAEEDYYAIDDRVKNEIDRTLSVLDDRERDIIECYFGIEKESEGMTLEAIGDKYDITKERVRQIKEGAIRKLRHNAHNLHKILGE